MSIEAMTRVLGLTVGDATRKLVLLAHANHAHADGTASWASTDTIAAYAECSGRSVQRHVARLVADGHLREGDQRFVLHLRGDRRPIVYDVAMSEATRAAWAEEATDRTGRRDTAAEQGRRGAAMTNLARGDSLSPRAEGLLAGRRGDTGDVHGATPVTSRGDTGVAQTVLEPSLEPPTPSLRSGDARTAAVAPKRPTRLPADWEPDPALKEWTRREVAGTPVSPGRELLQFRDYWIAKSGRDATKVDWPATWRRWIREEIQRRGGLPPSQAGPSEAVRHPAYRSVAEVRAEQEAREAARPVFADVFRDVA